MPGFAFLFVLVFIFIIVMAVVGMVQARKRKEELRQWAGVRGLRFDEGRDSGFDERYGEFDCLRSGSNRYAYNIVTGVWGDRRLVGFDYHYETYSTDSKGHRQTHHHHLGAVILYSRVALKPLVIRSENLFDKVAGFFGFDDIDFESAEFSRRFYVKSPDRKWAYDVIHPQTMEFLLGCPKINVQFGRECVMAWNNGSFNPAKYEQAIGVIEGILDRLPEYLIQQQKQMGTEVRT